MRLSANIRAIGALGPGFDDWPTLAAALGGGALAEVATRVPAPALLPPAERRRVGTVVKLALAAGLQACAAAGADPARLATVFASSGGDGANCHAICETLAGEDQLISPTRFHNSVTNAASGYWGIATGAQAPSNIVSAYDGSFAAGLVEALVQLACEGGELLLIAYDAPYPEPLAATRPIADAMGVALLLSADATGASLARVHAELTEAAPTRLADARLEALRLGIPAARALPLLAVLGGGACVLEYLDGPNLAVSMERS